MINKLRRIKYVQKRDLMDIFEIAGIGLLAGILTMGLMLTVSVAMML